LDKKRNHLPTEKGQKREDTTEMQKERRGSPRTRTTKVHIVDTILKKKKEHRERTQGIRLQKERQRRDSV